MSHKPRDERLLILRRLEAQIKNGSMTDGFDASTMDRGWSKLSDFQGDWFQNQSIANTLIFI